MPTPTRSLLLLASALWLSSVAAQRSPSPTSVPKPVPAPGQPGTELPPPGGGSPQPDDIYRSPNWSMSAGGPSATLEAEPTLRLIQSGTFDGRDQLFIQISQRLEANADTLAVLKKQAHQLDSSAQAEFKAAMRDVEQQEKQLKKSLKAARNANADNWESARLNVATDYSAYVNAVSRAQMSVTMPGTPTNARIEPGGEDADSRKSTATGRGRKL